MDGAGWRTVYMLYAAARVTASAGNIPGRVLIFGKSPLVLEIRSNYFFGM